MQQCKQITNLHLHAMYLLNHYDIFFITDIDISDMLIIILIN